MGGLTSIGSPPWSCEDIKASLPTFESLYHTCPIQDNSGGMKSPHMFATWFMAKFLSPPVIVKSGIFKGQSTWLLEQACSDAEIISIDLNLSQREHVSERVSYFVRDFADQIHPCAKALIHKPGNVPEQKRTAPPPFKRSIGLQITSTSAWF